MGVFALLIAQRFISDVKVRQAVEAVATLMQRDIIITDTVASLHSLNIELIFWLPGSFDETIYQQLQRVSSRIVFLAHISMRDPQERMTTRGDVLDKPGMLTLVAPFDPEEVHFLISNFYNWSAS
jgi:hypothetical protein